MLRRYSLRPTHVRIGTNDNIYGGIGTFLFLEKTKQNNLIDKKEGEFLDKKAFWALISI
jgi:hypothetical protein